MDIPFLWKIRIEILHIGAQSEYSDEDWMFCVGYDKESVLRRVNPILRAKERHPKNKGVMLKILECWKDKPVHYLTDQVINQIMKANVSRYLEEKKEMERFEKHPPRYSKPVNLSAPF
jgi:hypothetical protein